jgi:8-oxo-dGTP pyrophosphatase MutT (NUDIX family)
MSMKPDLTVAAIVEHDGRFLMVEERANNRMVFNQPAGHVERGEQIIDAVIRETLEETAWTFHPEALVGIYFWEQPERNRAFLRFAFSGSVSQHDPTRVLDRGIERAVWMSCDDLALRASRLRSPMVMRGIQDYQAGHRFPLEILRGLLPDLTGARDIRSRVTDLSMGAQSQIANPRI